MLLPEPTEDLLLPPRTRLLHIGPMKTGTTSVQAAASSRRNDLLAHGVRYPGTLFNHRRPLGALMGWSVDVWRRSGGLRPDLLDVDKAGIPPRREWDKLRSEIDADHERRIFLTHEFVSQADDATARRVVDAIGGSVHVCLTVRAPGRIVPSLWTQSITDDAQTEPFGEWLGRFYDTDAEPLPGRYRRAYEFGELVNRWAGLVGSENTTVLVVDERNPRLLTGSFEAMLGLPENLLDWRVSNRSLSAVDAELFRHVNVELRDRKADWRTFYNLVWKGAVRLGPTQQRSGSSELRVRMPPWAADRATEDGRRFAEEIRRSGVRVVGDLDKLAAVPPAAEWQDLTDVPVETAAGAVAGAIMAGQEQRKSLQQKLQEQTDKAAKLQKQLSGAGSPDLAEQLRRMPAGERVEQLAGSVGARQLLAAAGKRLRSRLRSARS